MINKDFKHNLPSEVRQSDLDQQTDLDDALYEAYLFDKRRNSQVECELDLKLQQRKEQEANERRKNKQ